MKVEYSSYVGLFKGEDLSYGRCNIQAVYSDLYVKLKPWGTSGHRKMNLLAIF